MEDRGAPAAVVPGAGLGASADRWPRSCGPPAAAEWALAEITPRANSRPLSRTIPASSALKEDLARPAQRYVKDSLAQTRRGPGGERPRARARDLPRRGPSLDGQRRAALEQELAKWFLTLIHRRLRTGKVQADVVQLATQVAETFAATVEGASVRASLPTLRRSVGLCPRCAQPYTGVADACPNA